MSKEYIELNDQDKEQIVVEWLQNADNEKLLKISQYLMISLAEEAIKMNAEVVKMGTSIHPKGVDERRDIALIVFQTKQSENKVEDLSSLLQTAPELLDALQDLIMIVDNGNISQYSTEYAKSIINKALGQEDSRE